MAAEDFDLDAYLRRCRFLHAYFNQGEVWFPNQRPRVRIADMDPVWRLNCTRFLERRAGTYVHGYTFGEISSMSTPVYDGGIDDTSGRMFSEFDLMGDSTQDEFEAAQDSRHADPVAWICTTTLYRALAAGLPTDPVDVEALSARARHWSTCPARTTADAACRCDAIRAARQEASA